MTDSTLSQTKSDLARLARHAKAGLVNVQSAAAALSTTPRDASVRLTSLAEQGWVARVRRGLYFVLPLDAATVDQTTVEDPWVLASLVYPPCYAAGWSAAEYWGLTEQLFRSTFVATAAHIRNREEELLGARFHLVRVGAERIRTIGMIWRGHQRVRVSSPERTIVDALRDPRWVGGIRHLTEILTRYRETPSADTARLVDELAHNGTGAAAKRLGFIAEQLWPDLDKLGNRLLELRTTGIIKLDPSVGGKGPMIKKWGLWANVRIPRAA